MARFVRSLMALVAGTVSMVAASMTALAQPPLGTAFTYQGRLTQGGAPANGPHNFVFTLFDAAAAGSAIGTPVTINGHPVNGGVFTVSLDFGASAFNGEARWLQVAVNGTTLTPRQPLNAVPYALQSRGIHVDAAGNAGIGTANPARKLHVAAPDARLHLQATASDAFAVTEYVTDARTWHTGVGASGAVGALDGKYYIFDDTIAQTRMVVDTLGNVGIGTALPSKRLTVAGDMEIGTGAGDYRHLRIGGGNSSGFLYGSFPHFGDGIHLGYNYYANAAGSNVVINPDGGTSRLTMGYGSIVLATAGPFFSEPQNRLVVLADGRVGVGTVSPGYPLHVRAFNGTSILGETSFGFTGAAVWGLATSPNGNATGVLGECFSPSGWDFFAAGAGINYGASSSIRWKRNIEAIDSPLERISRIRGVFFDWDQAHGGQHDVGMIAEEVGEVLPEVVQYEANGIDAIGMDYSKLTPLLVEAVKALRAEKDAEIDRLRADHAVALSEMRTRVEELETTVRELRAVMKGFKP